MDNKFKKPLDWIMEQEQHMIHLVHTWSSINSGSYNPEGVNAQLKAMADNFHWLGGEMDEHALADYEELDKQGNIVHRPIGRALTVTKRPEAPVQIFLGAHIDTVYGPEHPFQEPRFVTETIMNGPGVADIKGGIVIMLKALEALEQFDGCNNIGWRVVLNPDEEIGSKSSDPLLERFAKGCQLGMIFEPSLPDGTLAGARKGSGNFSVRVGGKAAHAGRNPEEGRNAIVAAAEAIARVDALNGKRKGVTFNAARLDGGGPLNMVPDVSVLRFNVRILQSEDEGWVTSELQEILAFLNDKDGIEATLHGRFTRSPKPMSDSNKRLFDFAKDCGKALQLEIATRDTGGCCDGNNLWKFGVPNIDTLGVRGAHIHSSDEIVYLDSLVERAQLSALMLMRLADGEMPV